MPRVAAGIDEPADATGVAAFFLALLDAAHRAQRGGARGRRGHALRDVLFGQALDMKEQLLV